MPGLQPGELGVGRAGAGLGHLGQAQVDRVDQDCGQQQIFVLGQIARFQVSEVAGSVRFFPFSEATPGSRAKGQRTLNSVFSLHPLDPKLQFANVSKNHHLLRHLCGRPNTCRRLCRLPAVFPQRQTANRQAASSAPGAVL